MEDRLGCLGVVILVGLIVSIGVAICGEAFEKGRQQATAEFRAEAVKAGVAEWRVDPKTGETRFVFGGRER